MHARRPGVVAVCLLSMTAVSVGCSSDSPEACFQSIRKAALNKDLPGLCNCLTVESQNVLAGGMVMMTGMLKMMGGMAAMGGPEAAAESQKMIAAVSAVLAKHGITDEALAEFKPDPQTMSNPEAISTLAAPVENKPQFIADMFAAMEPFNQGQGFGEQFTEQIAGTLKDVKIDGERATAVVVTTKGEEPLEFRKTADGWKLHINLEQMSPAAPSV